MSKYGNSSYWLKSWDNDDTVVGTMNDLEKKSHDLYKLSASKRAISNFVNIVTNDNIPVKFNTRGDSYTDGKSVVIGAAVVEPKDFDVAVGLALHEGSHIKLTNFELLKNIYSMVPQKLTDEAIKKGVLNSIATIKDLWNVVEDRRIDKYIFTSAPGYRDYYRAMYDKYFNDKLIDKALQSDLHTDESVESYMFRIINLHNKLTDINALKGLREIYKTIGLGSIERLKTSEETFEIAIKVFEIILSNLPTTSTDDDNKDDSGESDAETQSGEGSDDNSDDEPRDMSDDEFEDLMDSMDGSSPTGGDSDSGPTGGSGAMEIEGMDAVDGEPIETTDVSNEPQKVTLTENQKALLEKKIKKQKSFMEGDIKKKNITKVDSKNLDNIEESGSELTSVGAGVASEYTGRLSKGVNCIVVKKLTQSLLESYIFPMSDNAWNPTGTDDVLRARCADEVIEGTRLGKILGKKLQVRGEDRNTVYNRQRNGRIDKRMISSLGFGNENVFSYMETDSYKKANMHVSIDASGSMGGGKWSKTMTSVVALCKAVDMIQNLSIQVTFRTTTGNNPYIVMAYDSRNDKFSKVKKMFPYLRATGTTPEGLCFEAIMKNFLPANNDMDSYFLNISDGEPYFESSGNMVYYGQPAFEHTRKMVKQMEGFGIKTLSYYVEQGSRSNLEPSSGFKTMYGSSSKCIDITNIQQITKTVNTLFLDKA